MHILRDDKNGKKDKCSKYFPNSIKGKFINIDEAWVHYFELREIKCGRLNIVESF